MTRDDPHRRLLSDQLEEISLILTFVASGAKQNGTKLGDVILPPWAKGDPREFIRVHREVGELKGQ